MEHGLFCCGILHVNKVFSVYSRPSFIIFLGVAAVVMGLIWFFRGYTKSIVEARIDVISTPFFLDPRNIKRTEFGRLKWRGGVVLSSPASQFGGISGLIIDPEGKKIVGVTDKASWLKAELVYDGSNLSGVKNVSMAALADIEGKPFGLGDDEDSEALTLYHGQYLISFERNHRILIFREQDGRPGQQVGRFKIPDSDVTAMAHNGGMEALHVIRGGVLRGKVIAFSESLQQPKGYIKGWLFENGVAQVLLFEMRDGFLITEVTSLENGDLIFLERYYRSGEGVKMRLRLVGANYVKAGAKLRGDVLFEAGTEYEVDNMEGLAVHKDSQGKTILTVISDDNFSATQKTLLMQFELN